MLLGDIRWGNASTNFFKIIFLPPVLQKLINVTLNSKKIICMTDMWMDLLLSLCFNFTWTEADLLSNIFIQRLVRNFTREGLPCFPLCLRDMKLTGYCHTSICTHAEVISWWRSLLRLRKPFDLRVEAPSRAQESLCSWLFTGVQKELHWWVH